jgi:hypothetical protein
VRRDNTRDVSTGGARRSPPSRCLGLTEKFQAFGEKLTPLLQEAGIQPAEPTVFPAHNFVKKRLAGSY